MLDTAPAPRSAALLFGLGSYYFCTAQALKDEPKCLKILFKRSTLIHRMADLKSIYKDPQMQV